MKLIVIFGLLLMCLPLTLAYEITEIMYDPQGSDTNREWVEVYGSPLNSVEFIEGSVKHSLEYVQGTCVQDCVSIIADDAQRFLEEYFVDESVLVYEAGWSSLKNTGEYLALVKNDTVLIDLVYEPISALGESVQFEEGKYISAQPSPGFVDIKEDVEEVPEFGVFGALVVLGVVGLFVTKNRKD